MSSNPNFPDGLNIHPSTSHLLSGSGHPEDDPYSHPGQEKAIQKYGIAGRVWEAAYALKIYSDPPPNIHFDPPFPNSDVRNTMNLTIIELGSGSGLVGGNIARSLKARDMIILTDLPEVCPLLMENVRQQQINSEILLIRPLAWGNVEHMSNIQQEVVESRGGLTHILCSDLVYFPELLAPLLRSLIQLSSLSFARPNVEIIISYKIRSLAKETPFWSAFGLWFSFEPVLEQDLAIKGSNSSWRRFGSDMEGPLFVFIARRRPESHNWNVPSDDKDLLKGMGANGTLQPKESDTFESLLFMVLNEGGRDE
ncbi:tumor-related protein [Moniliophthora roreri]|uniref:Uncharacterized protein n=1 Tax=Moniliophthora roreri TaxID=221103 RepID=A0A0W0FRB5_MONRR|nr:tumor-related protein [Moniliophthora roreri]